MKFMGCLELIFSLIFLAVVFGLPAFAVIAMIHFILKAW